MNNAIGNLSIHYTIEENLQSPVKMIEYYVVDNKTSKILKEKEKIAGEKIYWKDNYTIAIIPYKEVEKHSLEVHENPIINETLIKIKY